MASWRAEIEAHPLLGDAERSERVASQANTARKTKTSTMVPGAPLACTAAEASALAPRSEWERLAAERARYTAGEALVR